MSLRERAKAAVKETKSNVETSPMWINIELRHEVNTAYDPLNPEADNTTVAETIRALEDSYTNYSIDGERVQTGDRRFYIDPDDLNTDLSLIDSIALDGVVYQLVSYTPIQQDVLVEFQMRRGG